MPILTAIGAAITGGALTGGAAEAAGGAAVAAAGGALAGGAAGIVGAAKGAKGGGDTPAYNSEAEKRKAAEQEANANRKRALSETRTVQTSALGNTGNTAVQKKTVLGG